MKPIGLAGRCPTGLFYVTGAPYPEGVADGIHVFFLGN